MKLFLLRHAQANDTWPDSDRALTRFGEEQVGKLCRILEKREFENVAQIWHSPFARAARTAEIFKECMNLQAPLVPSPEIRPDENPHAAARMIASVSCFGRDLIVVSHNPLLENLSDILLNGEKRGGKTAFGKCSIAALTMQSPPSQDGEYGFWSIDFLISPSVISD